MKQAITHTARKAVKLINCQDDNCPLLFANLTFQIFSSYLALKHQARTGGGEEEVREQNGLQYMSNSMYRTQGDGY
jgi:hypothetical protein